jgi:hypothetical protein
LHPQSNKMIYKYLVTLKNTGRKYIDNFSLLVLIISTLLFLREQSQDTKNHYLLLVCGLLIPVFIFYKIYRERTTHKISYYRFALMTALFGWLLMPFLSWLALPFAIMLLFERLAKAELEIGFTDEKITVNSLVRRNYQWSDFNNIVLKDNLLTLDFKDNRLLQRETIDEEFDATDEEFNDYCQAQLQKSVAYLHSF